MGKQDEGCAATVTGQETTFCFSLGPVPSQKGLLGHMLAGVQGSNEYTKYSIQIWANVQGPEGKKEA